MLLKNPTKSLTMPNNFRAHTANKMLIKRGKYVGVLYTGTKIKNCVLINKYLILFLGQPKKIGILYSFKSNSFTNTSGNRLAA